MKKLGTLFLGIILMVPSLSFAQEATTSTSTLSWSQKQSLIAVLTQELQVLETAISAILAQQAQMASTTQQIISTQQTQGQQIQQIQQNTTPVFGSTVPSQPATPSCVPNPTLTVSTSTNISQQVASEEHLVEPEEFSFTFQTGCPIDYSQGYSWNLMDQNGISYPFGGGLLQPNSVLVGTTSSISKGNYFDLSFIPSEHRNNGDSMQEVILNVTAGGNDASILLDSTTTFQAQNQMVNSSQ